MPNIPRPLTAVALLSTVLLLVGCGNDVTDQSASSTTATPTTIVVVVTSVVTVPDTRAPTTVRATTTAATSPSASPPPTAPPEASALDWDGVRYDFGRITGLSSNDNPDLMTFDRYQLYGDNG